MLQVEQVRCKFLGLPFSLLILQHGGSTQLIWPGREARPFTAQQCS